MLPTFLKFLREKLLRRDQVCIGYETVLLLQSLECRGHVWCIEYFVQLLWISFTKLSWSIFAMLCKINVKSHILNKFYEHV